MSVIRVKKSFKGMFIDPVIEDMHLDPYEYRVLGFLYAQAGTHASEWTGTAATIADACRISLRKSQSVLRQLEERELIERDKASGYATTYILLDPTPEGLI